MTTHLFVDSQEYTQDHISEFRKNFIQQNFRSTGIDAEGKSIDQILSEAKLDWEVKTSHFRYGQNYELRCDPGTAQVSYRSDTGEFFGLVRSREIWQNRDVLESFDEICQGMSLKLSVVGSLANGRDLYAAAYLSDYDLGGDRDEKHQTFITLQDSHRTGKGLSIGLFEVRIVCINGLHRPVRSSLKIINHVGELKTSLLQEVVENALNAVNESKEKHEKLANVTLTPDQAVLQLINAFGIPGNAVEDQPKIVQNCLDLFHGKAKGGNTLAAYNTAYGLLQSVTEHFNWHTKARTDSNLMTNIYTSYSQKMVNFESQLVGCFIK